MSGATYERALVRELYDRGFGALRLPSSGAGTDRPLPDLLIGTAEREDDWPLLVAAEIKSGKRMTLYADGDEVAALQDFCDRFGARPALVARYTSQGSSTAYFFVTPSDARVTDAGNYGLPETDIQERATWVVDG